MSIEGTGGFGDRDRHWGAPSAHWAALATVLLVGCGCVTYASCGVWQLGALVSAVAESASAVSPRPARVAPPAALDPSVDPSSTPGHVAPLSPPIDAPRILSFQPSESVQDVAEATEKAVVLGGEAASPAPIAPCDDIYVYIVSIADDPRLSAASLGVGKASPARLRRPGSSIGEWNVVSINDDWSGINPDVWLRKGSSLCRAELAGNPSRVHVPLPQRSKQRMKRRRRRHR